VSGPGRLAVRCAGKLVGALERGVVVDAMIDVFEAEWLHDMFAAQREEVVERHAKAQSQAASPTLAEHSLVSRVSQHMLRRTIQLIRGAGHGGMLLIADVEPDQIHTPDPSGLFGLRLKYRFGQDEPAHRYRTLLFQILAALAASSDKPSIGWNDFALDASPELGELEQSVFELSRLFANLSAIDGAVVFDKRFSVLGFGAEVSPDLPSPHEVLRAIDLEATQRIPEAACPSSPTATGRWCSGSSRSVLERP